MSEETPEEVDELIMRKDGDSVGIQAVVDGEVVFHAQPDIGRSTQTMRAALQTWVGRAYDSELDEPETEGAFQ